MPIVKEGEWDRAQGGKNLLYPEINSCLTLTLVKGAEAIGAHAVAVPGPGQLNINKLIDELKQQKFNPTRVYAIGDTYAWEQNIGALSKNAFTSVWQLGAAFGLPDDDFENIVVFDIARLAKKNGGVTVNVNVHPATRTVRVMSQDAKTLHQCYSWA